MSTEKNDKRDVSFQISYGKWEIPLKYNFNLIHYITFFLVVQI